MIDHATVSVWLVDGVSSTSLIDNILEFKLDKQINRHVLASLKGITGSRDIGIAADAQIEIKQQNNVIFRGKIVTYKISAHSQYWELELEAASATCELDLEVKRRTFQNANMTYADFIRKILQEYPSADFRIDPEVGQQKIGGFYLQFDETDWQLLLRLASSLNLALISEPTASNPQFYFGLPSAANSAKPNPKTTAYHLLKNMETYRTINENCLLDQASETDYELYRMEEKGDLLNVGDPVKYHGDRLVYRVTLTKNGSELIQECWLAKESGFQQCPIYNDGLRGLTIKGTVVERSVGQPDIPPVALKVRFTIDQVYKAKHDAKNGKNTTKTNDTENTADYRWFSYAPFYAAEGSTGLYCLPEVGEQVALYLPSRDEADAFVTNSVRRPAKVTVTDPNIKFLRTAFGKMIVFDEHGIEIVGKEGSGGKDSVYIKLQDDGNLTVYSDSNIQFQAAQTLNAHADGNVIVTADESLNLMSDGCSIAMNGGTDIKAVKVTRKQGKTEKKTKKKVKTKKASNGGGGALSGASTATAVANNSATNTNTVTTTAYWEYSQSTGQLTHVDSNGTRRNVATGYAGHGRGVNNPDMQGVVEVGPIPRGTWTIGRQYDSTTVGPHTMNLTAIAGTNTFNRDLFRIHGDNSRGDQSASHGCIILTRNIRDQIANSNINELRVVR